MLLKDWLQAEGTTGHVEVDRVVGLLAAENFDVVQTSKTSTLFALQVARRLEGGGQEDAMVVCEDLSDPAGGYVMRDGGKNEKPPRVALASYDRAPG